MPTIKEPHTGLFGLSDLDVLDVAVTEAWAVLSNPKHSRPWVYTREDIARHVIAEAAKGERDKAVLATRVVSQLVEV